MRDKVLSTVERRRRNILIKTSLVAMIVLLLSLSLWNLIGKRFEFYKAELFQENEKKIISGNLLLTAYFSRFSNDTHLISDLITDKIKHSHEAKELLGNDLSEILRTVLERNEFIYQIRLLDTSGYETLRLEKSNLNIVEAEILQYKGERYYFTESLKTTPDSLYISDIDLNVEEGVVQRPILPTVRIAKKIYIDDELYALIVINYNASLLFDQIDQFTKESGRTLEILNDSGYWLNHDDTEKEWGFMFNNKKNIHLINQNQVLWNFMMTHDGGEYTITDTIVSFEKINYYNDHTIILMSYLNESDFWKNDFAMLFTYVLIHVFILILFLVIVIIAARFYYARVLANEELKKQALYDTLTNIPNRLCFNKRLTELVESSEDVKKFAIFFMDLDGFKHVNDSYGHEIGDKVLIDVAHRLKRRIRESDQVFRLGGDEFTLLIDDIKKKSDVEIVAKKIIETISHRYVYDTIECNIGVSIGISVYPDDSITENGLLNFADDLMYEVKARGKNNYYYVQDNAQS